MFMAMAAHLFALILRQSLKKTLFFNAYDEMHGIERLNGYQLTSASPNKSFPAA